MLAGDLLGARVVDRSGKTAGSVQDVVVRRDDGEYQVLGLVLGRSALAGRLGFGDSLEPPTPWRHLLAWLRRHERYVRWEDVVSVETNRVEIGVDHASLPRHWHQEG
ncbi:PRC-barrel domain-containing protein [Nocardiopsis sp. L17-MgMaSL7]|jgi:sporulation protein YlmC with PRC-barrel domain|uniref:PRC-barrel domain-containing protein n=1 Tax=Nocardiopsis sp. L17-MgMaSL7 TaxID=1938893 RepID=UPI000D70B359|nr:PRC-barrel domain-containing protein [Nocardiopsis sp. L17-MgMaSL7]PWV55423.1 PRC-barrel domain protein [Nocardiopsis sp. L17-MgMaSL7]